MRIVKLGLLLAASAAALAGCTTMGETPARAEMAQAAQPVQADILRDGFIDPPMSARPRTWWHWMNGNITHSGIAADLNWLASVGMGGVQNFDASLQTPQIVDNRLIYMTPEWREAFRFAASEADRHGLELAIAASPGWSETGGPWVPPADGMKKLVWGETRLAGGRAFNGRINRAPDATGPYQTMAENDPLAALLSAEHSAVPTMAGHVAVLAVPLATRDLPQARFAAPDGANVPGAGLADNDLAHGATIALAADLSGSLVASYDRPVTVRNLRLAIPGLVQPFRSSPVRALLEARVQGAWTKVADLPLTAVVATHAFAPVTAREFRLRIERNPDIVRTTVMDGAPGAVPVDVFALGALTAVELADFRLGTDHRLHRAEDKAGFGSVLDYYAITSADQTPTALDLGEVIDLTDRVAADGTLNWTPPAGNDWLVLDLGWSLTGKTNHPAPAEATGLEVDKLDGAAVRRYTEHYLGMYRDTVGDDLFGERGLRAILTDSIEVGFANWTPAMEQEFAARRGYALRPWLPALTGMVIGSEAATEAFLFDYRQTLAELLADNHYGTVAQVAHENGLIVYGEALEDRRPLLGDDLAMRAQADVPMAALWTYPRGENVRTTFLGDMRGAASVAHVYGRPYVAAESMTSANSPWAFAPRDLRRFIDLEFASGINRPVIHTSVHQPSDTLQPGLSLMIFGQYFNRHETWAGMARPWVDYMSRSAYMLQQGTWFADVAVFRGEEAPITAQYATEVPAGLPRQYAFDFVNADMLTDALRVENGLIVATGGTRYRALQLGPTSRFMTLPTLRRIAEMAQAGATIVGLRPESSPSLADDAAEFARLADATWALPTVHSSEDIEAALAGMGVAPDFAYSGASAGTQVLFVHRQLDDGGHVYFVNNRANQAERIEARFRVTGRAPELWDAVTGTARPLPYRIDGDVTVVPLELGAEGSHFVVFRDAAQAPARDVAPVVERSLGAIDGPWTVSFQPGRGAPASITLPELSPLNESADAGVRYFSGVATYATSFTAPTMTDGDLWLDLGQVGDVAEVLVNGQSAGISWWVPNRVNIGALVRTGSNSLEVRVANLWVNRLIGDVQPGAERITFTAAPTYLPDAPLRPSGLIGPVSLVASE